MISCSHWGMFAPLWPPMFNMDGYKFADLDQAIAAMSRPDGIIKLVPLGQNEPQQIYQRLDFGKLD